MFVQFNHCIVVLIQLDCDMTSTVKELDDYYCYVYWSCLLCVQKGSKIQILSSSNRSLQAAVKSTVLLMFHFEVLNIKWRTADINEFNIWLYSTMKKVMILIIISEIYAVKMFQACTRWAALWNFYIYFIYCIMIQKMY